MIREETSYDAVEKRDGYREKPKTKRAWIQSTAEQLVLEDSGDIAYICADGELEYMIIDAGALLKLAMEIGSAPDYFYFFQGTCTHSIT